MAKYDIDVPLIGRDGNAFAILGAVDRGLRQAGADAAERAEFHAQATSGDYDHLLRTAMEWVNVV